MKDFAAQGLKSFKASETLLGIETEVSTSNGLCVDSFKASETLLGIETLCQSGRYLTPIGFKASETLLGIETPKATFSTLASAWQLQSL